MQLANGTTESLHVTSDPRMVDTDGDGITDKTEKAYRSHPRDSDTDDDELTDNQELNEIFSNIVKQDTDLDGLSDGLEYHLYATSAIEKDTDGDQINDSLEVTLANRNPRISDVPLPAIEIGNVDLRLDVRFVATTTSGTRELKSREVSSTLIQTDSKRFSRTDGSTHEVFAKVGAEAGFKVGLDDASVSGKFTAETGYTGQWTSSFTEESSRQTQKAYADSLTTDEEVSKAETVSREVRGASIKVAVNVQSNGNIAFSIENLQITAFLHDPRNPGRMLPIATLVPEPDKAYGKINLGPLIPERGPFVFASDQVFPSLVEDLMLDPRGLVFKVANFDLQDEFGRNFAFSSQEINDRTAAVVIDYGGADTDGDGEGDATQRFRVATSGGMKVDTNFDGKIDDQDRRIVFDRSGVAMGMTIQSVLEDAIGLKHFDEDENPTSTLNQFEQESSYSTRQVDGAKTLWRVRSVSSDRENPQKKWVIMTATGLEYGRSFHDRIIRPEEGTTLAFLQDLDGDRVTARWEYIYGSSDTNVDTDGDTLDDAVEVYDGWTVDVVGKGSITVYSSPARTDSDLDGLAPAG